MENMILTMTEDEWVKKYPLIRSLQNLQECFWINDKKEPFDSAVKKCALGMHDIEDASDRLTRFAPYIAKAFAQTAVSGGILESPLREIPHMKRALEEHSGVAVGGRMLLKCDSELPISGSIKARGGIYEVLKHAEELAVEHKLLSYTDDYACLAQPRFRDFFSQYKIAVGSTGNLGLSIGIMSAKLGFHVTVHMSADARQWKKDMLRGLGVHVIEYENDYSKAVAEGRRQAEADPYCYFIDDENSKDLFLGYTVAALRLKKQLEQMQITVDQAHPLFVYLPCGVGGGPGGVAFGIKSVFGDAAHCFFAEPTHSPCMLLGMYTGYYDRVSVQDFGIGNRTAADGLAVGRCSHLVGPMMHPFMSGAMSVSDERMYRLLAMMADTEQIRLEPSALAGVPGAVNLFGTNAGMDYLKREGLSASADQFTHIVWATGGSMVPDDVMRAYYEKGKALQSL